jgi:hypothetical protein
MLACCWPGAIVSTVAVASDELVTRLKMNTVIAPNLKARSCTRLVLRQQSQ